MGQIVRESKLLNKFLVQRTAYGSSLFSKLMKSKPELNLNLTHYSSTGEFSRV